MEPEIPPNTGNVARTCVATSTPLVLVGPLGFSLDDRYMRRAGLDYWEDLQLQVFEDRDSFLEALGGRRLVCASVRGRHAFDDFVYRPDDLLVFGRETRGLDPEFLAAHEENSIHIPQWGPVRSLNLSNSVALVVYAVHRQLGSYGGKGNPGE